MKESAAYQASAGQQIVESSGTASVPNFARTEPAAEGRARKATTPPGLTFPRFFTEAGIDPFDEVEWELRAATIGNERGELVFEQRDVEIPKSWSQQATNIVVSKYFRGQIGTPERERSVKQLIGRVVDTITGWARTQKYFATEDDLQAFSQDLKHILVYQKAAFNSPVWFNCGFEKAPQCSACFINSVQDTMDSILRRSHVGRWPSLRRPAGSGASSSDDRRPPHPDGRRSCALLDSRCRRGRPGHRAQSGRGRIAQRFAGDERRTVAADGRAGDRRGGTHDQSLVVWRRSTAGAENHRDPESRPGGALCGETRPIRRARDGGDSTSRARRRTARRGIQDPQDAWRLAGRVGQR